MDVSEHANVPTSTLYKDIPDCYRCVCVRQKIKETEHVCQEKINVCVVLYSMEIAKLTSHRPPVGRPRV